MNRDIKSFLGLKDNEWREPDGSISDILSFGDYSSIPTKSGAYIIVATDGTKFIYPRGRSSVIYIGKAKSLKRRLTNHYKNSRGMSTMSLAQRLELWHYQRYQYIKEFGGSLHWYTTRGTQTPEKLEHDLLAYFYDKYYSLPVGNGAFPKFH
ncbi:MAG: GIY-YIG nuclease family protein [Fulvivirga sp.]